MTRILISLIGHQPLPTLLALRHLRPDKVVLLGTNDIRINAIRNNLAEISAQIIACNEEPNQPGRQIEVIPSTAVDPWNITSVEKRLAQVLRREQNATLICDATGGTKAMSIGLTQFARKQNAEVIYNGPQKVDHMLESKKRQTCGGTNEKSASTVQRAVQVSGSAGSARRDENDQRNRQSL